MAQAVSREPTPDLRVTPRGGLPWLVRRWLACIRYREVLVLQGSPALGGLCAMGRPTPGRLGALAVLAGASILLVAHVFALNDWTGMKADLNDPHRAAEVFARKGMGWRQMAWLWSCLLTLGLLLLGILGPRPLVLGLAIAVLSLLYSLPASPAKGVPLLSSALHLLGGGLHFLLGYALFAPVDGRGVAIACFFALSFAAGHLTQEVRDYDADRRNRITTNAVAFGKRPTFAVGLIVFTLAYGLGVVLAAYAILPGAMALLAVLYPFHLYWSLETLAAGLTFDGIRRLQARYRALYALIGIALLAALLLAGVRGAG